MIVGTVVHTQDGLDRSSLGYQHPPMNSDPFTAACNDTNFVPFCQWMRSRRWLLLPLLALLTAARPVLAASCCTWLNPPAAGCDDATCQSCVDACDPACATAWDFQCSEEAQGVEAFCPANQCTGVCACPTPPFSPTAGPPGTPTPTPTNIANTDCCECADSCGNGGICPRNCSVVPNAGCITVGFGAQVCATRTPARTSTFTKTPTPTRVPPTATRTPGPGRCEAVPICYPGPPTPTPTGACPFSFTDATGDLGSTCLFTGIYNTSCLSQIVPLDGYFAGNGRNLTIAFSTQPTVSWTGRAISGNTATLQGYKIGGGALVVYPATATLAGTPAHPVLTIALGGQTIPYNLCAFPQGCTADESCPFGAYIGQFNQVISPILPPPAQYLSPVPATQ